MKKFLSILLALVLVCSFSLVTAVPVSAAGTPTIDGVISAGEWDSFLWLDATLDNQHTHIGPENMAVKIYMTNDADNLYVALDIPDTYDMRPYPTAEGGCDAFGLNIGVEEEERSYSRILQFATLDVTLYPDQEADWYWFEADSYWAQWKVATSPANTSQWGPDVECLPIPGGVQSVTVFDETHRVQEISIPLSDLGVTPGTVIRIGGSIRAASQDVENTYNFKTVYPAGLVWGDAETYAPYSARVNNETTGLYYQTIQGAIAAADTGDTINVAAGTYNERLTINKSLGLRGAQYGEDPTLGARTTPADESIIDITGLSPPNNPNVAVEIASGVSNVSVAGFTLIGSPTSHYSDESIIRCLNDGIAIEDNIMDGYVGVLYRESGTGLTVHRNRMVVNKNGVVIQHGASSATISDNVFTLGNTPAGDESAIYMTGCSESSVTGNTATGFIHNAALAGSHLNGLTVSGNTFTGNAAGISIFGSSTFITISNNDLSDSLISGWGDSGCGICIKAQDVVIIGNQIRNNADKGVKIDQNVNETLRNTISNNNIVGNTNYGVWVNTDLVPETVDATKNWWGAATGPDDDSDKNPYYVQAEIAKADKVSENVDYLPWLIHTELASGWNVYSTPIAPDDSSSTIDKALNVWGVYDWGVDDLALYFDPSIGESGGWQEQEETTSLTPLQGLYIKLGAAATIDVVFSTDYSEIPSQTMYAGWNLIGLAELYAMAPQDALTSAYYVAGANNIGYSQVVSPAVGQTAWSGVRGSTIDSVVGGINTMLPTNGYWLLMVNEGTLGGFTSTPITLLP